MGSSLTDDLPDLVARATALAETWALTRHLSECEDVVAVPGGVGKATYRVGRGAISVALQIRALQPFHEPVAEAHTEWAAQSASVPRLLAWGGLTTDRFYVFQWIDGEPAAVRMRRLEHAAREALLRRIGAAFANLCRIPTTRFGYFRHGLEGSNASWLDFVAQHLRRNVLRARRARAITRDLERRLLERLPSVHLYLPRCEQPRLVYVDVSLENVIVEAASDRPVVVDHDYLISGDPGWVLARIDVLHGDTSLAAALTSEFREAVAATTCGLYRVCHALELLLLEPGRGAQTPERRDRLVGLIARELDDWGLCS